MKKKKSNQCKRILTIFALAILILILLLSRTLKHHHFAKPSGKITFHEAIYAYDVKLALWISREEKMKKEMACYLKEKSS